MKKEYCIMVNGNIVRTSDDMPYRCSKQTAINNVKYYQEQGKKAEMLKIGRDIELGKE